MVSGWKPEPKAQGSIRFFFELNKFRYEDRINFCQHYQALLSTVLHTFFIDLSIY